MFDESFKMLGFIGILLTLLFSWTWHAVNRIEEREWTQNEQAQYEKSIDRQVQDLHREIDHLKDMNECKPAGVVRIIRD